MIQDNKHASYFHKDENSPQINDVEVYAERIPSRFKPIAQVTDTQQGIMDTRYTASQPQSTCSRDQKLNLQCVLQGKEKGGVASLPDEQLLSTDKSGHVPNERQQEKIGVRSFCVCFVVLPLIVTLTLRFEYVDV